MVLDLFAPTDQDTLKEVHPSVRPLVNSVNVRRFLRYHVGNRRETWESSMVRAGVWHEIRPLMPNRCKCNANQLEELSESSTEAKEIAFQRWRGLPACPKPPHFAPLLGLPHLIPPTTLRVSRPSEAYGTRSARISLSNCVACSVVIVSSERVLREC